jgi:hypothetical protein
VGWSAGQERVNAWRGYLAEIGAEKGCPYAGLARAWVRRVLWGSRAGISIPFLAHASPRHHGDITARGPAECAADSADWSRGVGVGLAGREKHSFLRREPGTETFIDSLLRLEVGYSTYEHRACVLLLRIAEGPYASVAIAKADQDGLSRREQV